MGELAARFLATVLGDPEVEVLLSGEHLSVGGTPVEAVPERCRITGGADKGYDAARFVDGLRRLRATPHVAQRISSHRGSNLDGRTVRHAGYRVRERARKRNEEVVGWLETIAGREQAWLRATDRVGRSLTLAAAA